MYRHSYYVENEKTQTTILNCEDSKRIEIHRTGKEKKNKTNDKKLAKRS